MAACGGFSGQSPRSFASWNVQADRFSGAVRHKNKHTDVCEIVFEFLSARTAVGSCVFLQEVEPKLFEALVEKMQAMKAKIHRMHFVSHGNKVWPVDKFPWSWLRPREWSIGTEQNVGNVIIVRIGSGPSVGNLLLEGNLLLDGEPSGNHACVIRCGKFTYVSAHICTVIYPIRHNAQLTRLKQFFDSEAEEERVVIMGADLNNPCSFSRHGRPGTWPLASCWWPWPKLAIDCIISNSSDFSQLTIWQSTVDGNLSDHIGVKCCEVI